MLELLEFIHFSTPSTLWKSRPPKWFPWCCVCSGQKLLYEQRNRPDVDFAAASRVITTSFSILIAVFYNPSAKCPYRLTEACVLNVFDVLRSHAKTIDQLINFGDFKYPNTDWGSLTSPEYDGSNFCSYLFKH